MRRSIITLSVFTVLAIAGMGCGDDGRGVSRASTTAADSPAASSARERDASGRLSRRRGAAVKVMRSRYGRMLFDGKGRALYLFTRERGRASRCYGACAQAWPPFYTRGRPRALAGVKQRLLGTTRRRGGRRHVTYNGHPLYYYVSDVRAGQVTCQDVAEFGGTWLVVAPAGNAIR
jgi:predicted lipoprotein with Yx(FWY)xxD motif